MRDGWSRGRRQAQIQEGAEGEGLDGGGIASAARTHAHTHTHTQRTAKDHAGLLVRGDKFGVRRALEMPQPVVLYQLFVREGALWEVDAALFGFAQPGKKKGDAVGESVRVHGRRSRADRNRRQERTYQLE